MKSVIEELELICDLNESFGNSSKANEIKRAISILQKNINVFWFPSVMNFRSINTPVAVPAVPSHQSYNTGGVVAMPSPSHAPVTINPNPTAAPIPISGAGVSAISAIPISHLFPSCEPMVGEEIFGIWRDESANHRFCMYTWQEHNNPKEIIGWAVGTEGFSAGVRYMPCRKFKSERVLFVCTNECCKQP